MKFRPARPVSSRRSRRLALVAGATLAVAMPGLAAAATDDTKPPTALATPTTAPADPATGKDGIGVTTSTAPVAPTDGSVPAAVQPLAVVDIGATGPGVVVGPVVDGPTAVANLGLVAMPVAAGATVAEYSLTYTPNLADPAAPSYSGSSTIISSAQSAMPSADILAAYQAAIGTLGQFDATTSNASEEGVTTDRVRLEPVAGDGAATLGSYEIAVTHADDAPGLVIVEVDQTLPTTDGVVPPLPAAVAPEFAAPQAMIDSAGWTVTGWTYADGFNQFSGTPYKRLGLDVSAGTGTIEDLQALAPLLTAQFGTPTYENVDAESFSYTFADNSMWYGSFREYAPGNELNLSWSLSA